MIRIYILFPHLTRPRKIYYSFLSFTILKKKSYGIPLPAYSFKIFVFFTLHLIIVISLFYGVRYVGRLFVKALGKPVDILTKLNEMAGFPPNEEIELYEVSCPVFSYCLVT